MSSASIREALDLALTYFTLTFAFTRFDVSDTPQGIRIEMMSKIFHLQCVNSLLNAMPLHSLRYNAI